jgi:hypothetical protein
MTALNAELVGTESVDAVRALWIAPHRAAEAGLWAMPSYASEQGADDTFPIGERYVSCTRCRLRAIGVVDGSGRSCSISSTPSWHRARLMT